MFSSLRFTIYDISFLIYHKNYKRDTINLNLNLKRICIMKDLHRILDEITKLTTYIETNHPALYRILDENTMTLPVSKHPHMDKMVMQEYLESLKQLLQHHLDTHKNK